MSFFAFTTRSSRSVLYGLKLHRLKALGLGNLAGICL